MQAEDLDEFSRTNFTDTIEFLAAKSAAVAEAVQTITATTYTVKPVAAYWDPVNEKLAVDARNRADSDVCLYKSAAAIAVGCDRMSELDDYNWWVKVAHSPTVRRLSNAMHFTRPENPVTGLEGKPIAAMIASGLVGAGLGYGTGWVGEQLIPDRFQRKGKLRKNLAAVGGLAGLGIGSVPGLVNLHDGRSFNDDTLFSGQTADGFDGKMMPASLLGDDFKRAASKAIKQAYAEFPGGENPISSTLGSAYQRYTPIVKVNELGEVLSGAGAGPRLTAMTMGAAYGASQFNDPNAIAGTVTPHQMGLFGQAMGAAGGGLKGYAAGFLVGKGLGVLTGLPQPEQNKLQQAGALLGVVTTLVPKLFG